MAEEYEILTLGLDARPAEEGGRRYVKTLDEIRAATRRGTDANDEAEASFRGLAQVGIGAATLAAGRLAGSLRGLAGLVASATGILVDFTALGLGGVAKGLHLMADGMRDANGALTRTGRFTEAAATAVDKLSMAAKIAGATIFGLQVLVTGLALKLGRDLADAAIGAAVAFTPAFNRVRTLLSESREETRLLSAEVSTLAGTIGADGREAAGAMYQTISAMPQLAESASSALDVLTPSLQAARTGFTDAETAVAAITGILNAFGLEASRATEVSDALFYAQQQGVTTFGEIAASIGSVADLAASLGGRYQDVLAILATTADGTATTAERFQQLRGTIAAIIKPTDDAKKAIAGMDIDLSAAALRADGLAGYLQRLIAVTKGDPDVLARIFPQESLAILLALSRQTDELTSNLEGFNYSAGQTKRTVDTMNDSWEAQRDLLDKKLSTALRGVGDDFEGVGVTGLKVVNALLEKWNQLALVMERTRLIDNIPIVLGRPYKPLFQDQQSSAPFLLPGAVVTPSGPRRSDPITRPAEPIGYEYSSGKIREFENARRAAANLDLARTGDLAAYERAVRGVRTAVNDLVLAEVARNREAGVSQQELDQLALLYEAAQQKAEAFRKTIDNIGTVLQAQGLAIPGTLSPDARRAQFTGMGGRLDPVQAGRYPDWKAIDAALNPKTDFRSAVEGIADGVRGLVDLGDAAGILSERSRQALGGLSGLVGSLAGLQGASGLGLAGGILGAAGAGAVVLSSLLGGGEDERERQRILEGNTEALTRLAESLSGFRATANVLLGAESEYNAFLSRSGRQKEVDAGFSGLDLPRLRALAKEYGIEVFDEDGNVLTAAVRQLVYAIDLAKESLVGFGDSLDEQRRSQDLYAEIFDLEQSPELQLQNALDLLTKNAPGVLGGLSGLDVNSADDRALLEAALRDVTTRFLSGALDPAQLGDLTRDEFLSLLLQADKGLDAFTDSVKEATGAMLNIPKALPLELIRQGVYASIARRGAGGGSGPGSGGPTDTGGGLPPGVPGGVSYTLQPGAFVIQTQAKDGEELLREIERAVQARAAQGQPTYLPGVRTAP